MTTFRAETYRDDVSPWVDQQHPVEAERVEAMIEALDDGWEMPPVLVVEDEGNGCIVLDGHHRCAAARQLDIRQVAAHVVALSDYCKVLDQHFDGCGPARLGDLDPYILVDGSEYNRR